jgi:glycosyltransferase involved in cell wall biosynthesis
MPLVSVIVPTFQRPDFLRAALRSVLRQTFKDLEVVVVDDGSAMDLKPVLSVLDDVRLRYVRHDSNRGEAAARNTGIRRASGEYVAFLDDDDEWLPEKVSLQLETFARSSPTVGCVTGGFAVIHDGRVISEEIPTRRGDLLEDLLVRNIVGPPSTVMIRRDCLDRVGLFDESIAFGVDYDLWIRVAERYHFEFVPEIVTRYTLHRGQMSNDPFIWGRGHDDLMRKHDGRLRRDRWREARFYLRLGRTMSLRGHVTEARRALVTSLRHNPLQIRPYVYLALSLGGPTSAARARRLLARIRRLDAAQE